MKSLLLLFAVCCQLAVAVGTNIGLVVIESDGNTTNSCSTEEKLEIAIQGLRDDVISRLIIQPQCGEGIWHRLVSINMSSADNQCPDGWVEENEGGVRACGRRTVRANCKSAVKCNTQKSVEERLVTSIKPLMHLL